MSGGKGGRLAERVVAAAEAALARRKYVAPIEVLQAIGWLPGRQLDRWRQGRIDPLERAMQVAPDKLASALDLLAAWARAQGLEPAEAPYLSADRDRSPLRFTVAASPEIERAFRTHWYSPAAKDRLVAKQSAPPDLLAIVATNTWHCAECGQTGDLHVMEHDAPLCLTCADLDHLVFLPAGDAALTRRAKKAGTLSAVVVRWNKPRKRYDRQGLLVEEAALAEAERQCLADDDARARRRERDAERRAAQDAELTARMAARIRELYPGCPPERATEIAAHTAARGSGRVGRSAAGRALDDRALTLAVIASIRHLDTDYDDLLMAGVARDEARAGIHDAIDRVLAGWASP